VADFEALLGNDVFEVQPNNVESAYYQSLPTEEDQEAQKNRLLYYYMYDLSPTHRSIQSLVATSHLLKASGIEPIFYLTPINYQRGERVWGETFSEHLRENVSVIETILQAEQIEPLNLIFDLQAYNFLDTEHLTENGKRQVAQALAARLNPAKLSPSLTTRPTTTPPRSNLTGLEPQPVAAQIRSTSTPLATIPATNTAVIPTFPTPSAGQGEIKAVERIGTYKPVGNYFIDLYRVRYRTLNDADRPITVRANVYIPQVYEKTVFPILVYGGGTTGLGPGCEPLNELSQRQNWGGYHYQMLEYAAQGFIMVWPNGQGYDDGQPAYPYFIAKDQGQTMLDAARAVYRFFEEEEGANLLAEPQQAVFFGGYSSGGHAAFAAKDLATEYAPELAVKGVLGHGPTTNIETLLQENPIFSPYLVHAYSTFFGEEAVDPTLIFNDRWLPDFTAEVMTRCVDTLYDYYSPNAQVMYRPPFREALYNGHLRTYSPNFQRLLRDNATGLAPAGADIPVLILQGTADTVVTPPSQEQFATQLCRLGNQVTYLTYLAADHAQARNESFRDTINWMEALAEGELPESSCESLRGQ
jgi:pimeloyl-ACP methyl ester carboxylesterase